jgi:hypothetical protein
MSVEDIEKAVAKLPPDQLAEFRAWFEAFDAVRFDEKIERDAKAGKLDALADQAIEDFRKGRAQNLLDLMGKLEWDASCDYKAERTRESTHT